MSLADALARQTKRGPRSCGFARFAADLPPDDRGALQVACETPPRDLPHAVIHKALVDEYPDVRVPSANRIGDHRNGSCSCRDDG